MTVDEKNEDPMIGDILSSIKSIINENEDEATESQPAQEAAPEPEVQPEPELEDFPVFEELAPEPVREPTPEVALPNLEDSIISQSAAEVGAQQFVKLNNMIRMGNSNVTLSDITRSLLRPMLREWLDENLPPMVEQMVEYEIKRLTNRVTNNK